MPLISLEAKQIVFAKMKYQKFVVLPVNCKITSYGQLQFLNKSRYFNIKNHSLDMLIVKKNLTTQAFYFYKVLIKSSNNTYFSEYSHWQAWIAWKPPSRPRVIKYFFCLTT